MADEKAELKNFLGKVDDIGSLIKDLANAEVGAVDKADQYLKKVSDGEKKNGSADNTEINRTVINKEAFQDSSAPPPGADVDQRGFMAVMEQDANDRRERRKISEKEASELKEQGNDHFKAGRYKEALDLYTQAIGKVRDWTMLYTNRAQTYIKLEMFEKALEDCDWALRVFENCLKAYIHQGRAYLGLKEFDKAIASFERAMVIEPKKKNAIQGYIREVEHARRTLSEETSAQDLFASGDEGAKNLVELLERLHKSEQLPLFYSGGLRLVEQFLMANSHDKTLLRTQGGLNLFQNHPTIARCFGACPRNLSDAEIDMCASLYNMLVAGCSDNVENQRQLLDNTDFVAKTFQFLESKSENVMSVKKPVLNLFHVMSQTDMGRSRLVAACDTYRLLTALLDIAKHKPLALLCSTLLNNIAIDKKFKSALRDNVDHNLLPALEASMMDASSDVNLLPICISTATNLCGDVLIRKKISARKQTWNACVYLLKTYEARINDEISNQILHATMGLVMNLSYNGNSEELQGAASALSEPCCRILMEKKTLEERCLSMLSYLLPHSQEAVDRVCELGITGKLLDLLQNNSELTALAMKCLTSITQYNTQAQTTLVDYSKGVKTVLSLLQHSDDKVVGNAALCLGHCAADARVCKVLTRTDIIKDLLVHARDQHQHHVQHNCAILIAKLCRGDTKHLERLRELHGIEILHDVIKHEQL